MIYVNLNSTDACLNFGCEYYYAVVNPLPDDVFMLWRTTPTLMIGKYQNTREEVDLDYAAEHGIGLVRRLSGGGTIYTDMGGWQFTFITHGGGSEIEFERFMTPVTNALRSLGLDAAATGRNDILLKTPENRNGAKISGNTQYKKKNATVHHGSLLFETDLDTLCRAATPKSYKISSKAIKSVRERVTNIRPNLPRDMDGSEFRDYLVEKLAGRAAAVYPDEAATREINSIADKMFRPIDTVLGADPAFDFSREIHLPGGTVELGLTIKSGKITAASVSGDFFAGESDDIARRITGCDFDKDAVAQVLHGMDLYMMDSEKIAEMLFSEEE